MIGPVPAGQAKVARQFIAGFIAKSSVILSEGEREV